jgi:spermidine/putrescine transport system permease protein
VSAAPRSADLGRGARASLLALPGAWAAVLLLLPLVVLVATSFGTKPPEGFVRYDWSGEAWGRLAGQGSRVAETAQKSIEIAFLATLLSIAIATPVAWWIAGAPPRRRPLWLLLVVLPSWTSFLLRTYAWRFLFGNEGPVNGFLASAFGSGPVRFVNTDTAVVVGLVYGYLPFAVLPIYVAVERLDRDLIAAARDLGATPSRAFWRVAFPLTLPGTIAGAVLVFVPSIAAFVTPAVLGGADTYLVGQLVQERYIQARDWPFGAAVGVALAVLAFVCVAPLRRRRADA